MRQSVQTMMQAFHNKWFQLLAMALFFVLSLIVTLFALDSVWRGVFVFGETPRGVPVGSGTILVLSPVVLVYLVFRARQVMSQRRPPKRRAKRKDINRWLGNLR